jgi:hypothetical protein
LTKEDAYGIPFVSTHGYTKTGMVFKEWITCFHRY